MLKKYSCALFYLFCVTTSVIEIAVTITIAGYGKCEKQLNLLLRLFDQIVMDKAMSYTHYYFRFWY